MKTTYTTREAAQSVAQELNDQYGSGAFSVTFISGDYAQAIGVPCGGFYILNAWNKLI